MSSLAKESTEYVPDFGGNQIMMEIYQAKMQELTALGPDEFKAVIKDKLVQVVEKIVDYMYEAARDIYGNKINGITEQVQLFSWMASEWERHGESTGKAIPKQPHFFIKALIDPEIGLFKYSDKCYFHRKEGEVWKLNTYFIHEWEEHETGYSAAVSSNRQNLTEVWTNRKAICLYSRDKGFTALKRGKQIDFDWGYEADKSNGEPSYRYIEKNEKNIYRNVFGWNPDMFIEEFTALMEIHAQTWVNIDMIELQNILTETLILFHELIHVLTNTAHQAEKQDTELEVWPAMPRDYPVEEFSVEDWPDFKGAKQYMAAIGKEEAEEYNKIGHTIWPFFSDGSGHGVEFCNMYSLFAGMRGQTTLCSVTHEKRKERIKQQKKLPGGLKRDPDLVDGSGKKPPPKQTSKPKKKYVPKKGGDGTTTWVQELYIKLKF